MQDVIDAPLKFACSGCGASLAYSAKDRALKCEYCGTVTEIPVEEEETPDDVEGIVPLGVDITALTDIVYQHLASGDLTPDHLLEHASFVKKEQLYVPVYAFHGSYKAQWTASFGYDRQEHYTDYETRYENGKSRRVAVSKTRTVTDWRPVNGNDSGRFHVLAYGGTQLNASSLALTNLVEYKLGADPVAFDPAFVKGVVREEWAVNESDAYTSRAKDKVNGIIDASVQQHGQGDRQRDWHWTANIKKEATTLLVPICHAVYEFEGKQYNVWVNGANGDRIVADPLPVDEKRKQAVAMGFAPLGLAVVAGGFAIFSQHLPWALPISTLVVVGIFGVLRKNALIGHSKKLRQATLASRRVASANTAGMTEKQKSLALASIKRPERNWLNKAVFGVYGVAAAAILAVALPFASTHGSTAQYQDASASSEQAAPAPVQQAMPAPPPQAQQAAAAVDTSASSAETAASATNAATQAEAASAAATPPPAQETAPAVPAAQPAVDSNAAIKAVNDVLSHVVSNDWAGVDQAVGEMQAAAPQLQQGDRRASRAANADGLAALRLRDMAGAVQAFERGVGADPSDIEVSNNLGYALIQAGRARDGTTLLCGVIARAPQRSSAWANLAEGLASDEHAAAAALKVAVHYSGSREKTVAYLQQAAATHPNVPFRAAVQDTLNDLANIPGTVGNPQSTRPAVVQGGRSDAATAPGSDVSGVAGSMVADGRACMAQKQYACAATNATNALRLKPGYVDALNLKNQAEAAQAEAMKNIDIK